MFVMEPWWQLLGGLLFLMVFVVMVWCLLDAQKASAK